MKRTLTISTQEREPKLYTMIFLIGEKYHKSQIVSFDLETAVERTSIIIEGKYTQPTTDQLWWSFSMTFDTLKNQFKNAR